MEKAGVDSSGGKCTAGVENTGAKTYGKPSIQKSLTVEAPIRKCLIVNGRKSPISGKPNRTDCLVPRVGVIHFDVEADSDSGAQKLRVFILLLYSVFRGRVCNAYDNYSRMLVYCMI